ncbi:ABC transporter permease subunit [Candidatus Gottesmanbacteria bacterium]|nr:ABC transporter permease subunit [Candidatus Gottesmanbacteria bacterium]
MNPFEILFQYREAFLSGFLTTVYLVFLTAVIGTAIGIALEFICNRFEGATRRLVDATAFGVAAIPALVILFWLYYPGQALLGVVISPFWTALAALTLINIFTVYRIVADSMRDFPRQYIATGQVCGLTRRQIVWYIQAPLLLRAALPRWIDQQVIILQTSLFASFISVEETFRVAQRINSVVYQPVVIYTSMALIFLLTAGSAMYLAKRLRMKYQRDYSER